MTIYDEIRAALAEATPGPWTQESPLHNWIMADRVYIAAIARDENGGWSRHNARLIALAPTLAEMALRLKAAEKEAQKLADALEPFVRCVERYEHLPGIIGLYSDVTTERSQKLNILPREVFYRARAALAAYRQKEGE